MSKQEEDQFILEGYTFEMFDIKYNEPIYKKSK